MLYLDKNHEYHIILSASSLNVALLAECWQAIAIASNVSAKAEDSLLSLIAELADVPYDLLASETESVLKAIHDVNFAEEDVNAIASTNKDDSIEKVTLAEYHQQLIVGLVNSGLANNLESAISIAEIIPHRDLKSYIESRVKFLNRDAIAEEKRKGKETEQVKEVISEIADGSFYDGLDLSQI